MYYGHSEKELAAERLALRQRMAVALAGSLILDEDGMRFASELNSIRNNFLQTDERYGSVSGGSLMFRSPDYKDFHGSDDDQTNSLDIIVPTNSKVRIIGNKDRISGSLAVFRVRMMGDEILRVASRVEHPEIVTLANKPKS